MVGRQQGVCRGRGRSEDVKRIGVAEVEGEHTHGNELQVLFTFTLLVFHEASVNRFIFLSLKRPLQDLSKTEKKLSHFSNMNSALQDGDVSYYNDVRVIMIS